MENTTLESDFLQDWASELNLEQINRHRSLSFKQHIQISHWDAHRQRLAGLPVPQHAELHVDDMVEIKLPAEYENHYNSELREALLGLLPWRTGPFRYGQHEVNAEWASYYKWHRIKSALPRLTNRRIADVGCNSGYFMFQLLKEDPQLVLGLDPSGRCFYQYHFLTRGIPLPTLHFEPLGLEHLKYFENFFHVLLCMGVLYHRRDPYSACRLLYQSLKREGTLILETLIYPGEEPIALCPKERYAKMRNVWFVPTLSCLTGWLERAGFKDIEVIDISMTSSEEQQQTEYAPYESLKDFLDQQDPSLTIEGYHAPTRAILKASTT